MAKSNSTEAKRARCKKKFLRFFRKGYHDPKYVDWERDYKWQAHLRWEKELNQTEFRRLLDARAYPEIAMRAVKIESATNLLFSFEKMALRDAVKPLLAAEAFAVGLFDYCYGTDPLKDRFERFTEVIAGLPRKQTRVLTWPLQTVFGFIARPRQHIFLKPRVTQVAAIAYDFDFQYESRPNWKTYSSLLAFAEQVRKDTIDLRPRDMIDLQSFIWVQGSDEYEE